MRNNQILSMQSLIKKILSEYDLCDYCIARLFANNFKISLNHKSGARIRIKFRKKISTNCFICKNLFLNLHFQIHKIQEISLLYQFSSFLMGIVLKTSIIERDDFIKSKFQLQGINSIKSSITTELSKSFAKRTKKKIDHLSPDLVFTINLKDNSIDLRAKSISLYGRYKKNTRNLSQKQRSCQNCLGNGCKQCDNHGISEFNSVEGFLAKLLFEKFKAEKIKVTWIGGEEKNSLVGGSGRPFFTKIINPQIRHVRFNKKIVIENVIFTNFKIIKKIPTDALQFRSKVKLLILTEDKILNNSLKVLDSLKKTSISIYDHFGNFVEKKIFDIKYEIISPNSFSIVLEVEGGFPVKRFIEGKDVEPNLNDLIDNNFSCKEFDFQDIVLE